MAIEQNIFYDTEISFVTPEAPAKTSAAAAASGEAPPAEPQLPQAGEHEMIELELPVVVDPDDPAAEPEPEPVVVPEKNDGTGDPPSSDSTLSSSPYSVFANALFEEGVITQFDQAEFDKMCADPNIGPAMALVALNKVAITDGIDAYKDSLNPYQKSLLEAFEHGVPAKDAFDNQVRKTTYATIKPEDLADEVLAEQIYTDSLRIRQYTPEEIAEEIQEQKDLGRLVDKAKKALPVVKKYETDYEAAMLKQAQDAKVAQDQANAARAKTLHDTLEATTEIIPGVKLVPADRKKMLALISEPVQQDKNSGAWMNAIMAKRAANPVSFDITLAYMVNSGMFDGKMDKVVKVTKTKAVQELSKVFESPAHASGSPERTRTTAKQGEYLAAMTKEFKSN